MGWEEILNKQVETPQRTTPEKERPEILVVDDEAQICSTLLKYLSLEGYSVVSAADADEALSIYKDRNPQIIFTDIRMPGKSGLELLEEIRKKDNDTEIIVMTGHGDMDSAIRALKLRASDFIVKPIDFEVILLTIERASARIALREKVKRYTTDLEHLLAQIKTSKNYLEAVFRNSPNAMITCELDGVILSWNERAEEITGYSASEVVGKTLEQVLRLDNILLELDLPSGAAKTHDSSVSQILTKDRQLRYISRNVSQITGEDGKAIGIVESFIDLTEQIKSERLLEKRYLQVQTINDISKMVSSENDLIKLSRYVLHTLHQTFFESSLLSLFFEEKPMNTLVLKAFDGQGKEALKKKIKPGKKYPADKGIPWQVFRTGKALVVDNVPASTDYFRGTLSEAASVFAFPIRSKKRMYGVLNIENAERIRLDDSDRFMLETISEFLGVSAERIHLLNKITQQNRLLEKQADDLRSALRKVKSQNKTIENQNKRLITDLRKAGEFQKSLLPERLPQYENVRFAASYLPSSQLGGDIYDIFDIDDELVGIILADASGHGVAAAMLSAMFKMTLQKYAVEILDPAQVMTKLNSDFCQVLQMGEFFTAFYAILNRKTGQFIYSNAAHPRPLLYNYSNGSVAELDTEGFLLGVMDEGISYEQDKIILNENSRLVIYTDGINEAADKKGKMYGDERVRLRLLERADEAPEDFLKALYADLKKHTGSDIFEDDVTVLVMDFNIFMKKE